MNKATAAEMRKALEMVHELKLAGILFVPIPIIEENDKREIADLLERQLNKMDSEA